MPSEEHSMWPEIPTSQPVHVVSNPASKYLETTTFFNYSSPKALKVEEVHRLFYSSPP
jgi:hypothetical protein